MTTRKKLLLVALLLVVVGGITIALQPGGPDPECVPDGQPSSGFVDAEQDCNISIESWNEMADYASSPKVFRIAGLAIIVVGLGVAGSSFVVGRRKGDRTTA